MTTVRAALSHLSQNSSITLVSAITARIAMPGTAGLAAINAAVEALVKPVTGASGGGEAITVDLGTAGSNPASGERHYWV